MLVRANFEERVVVRPDEYLWVDSPAAGVQRMMLDRVGEELARATSLVRFEPNSEFSSHVHSGGEEYLVLEGVFEDENGAYSPGTYVRNPAGTSHQPRIGEQGALIFVKLQQFESDDQTSVVVDTGSASFLPGLVPGLDVLPLHQFGEEQVALVRWAPHTEFDSHTHVGGEEIFVIEGCFYDEQGKYPQGSWLRSPKGSSHKPFTKGEGALIYVKLGHL